MLPLPPPPGATASPANPNTKQPRSRQSPAATVSPANQNTKQARSQQSPAATISPANQYTKQARSQQSPAAIEAPDFESKISRKPHILQQPRPRPNPIVWFGATLCLIFSLVLIFFGIATLVIYLANKPRSPMFDKPNANLNAIYFDSPEYFNSDLIFLAKFSNPTRKWI